MSTLSVLHTPVTFAPTDFAICTANVPTPPDAPLINTLSPGWTFPWSRTAASAVNAESPTAADCSDVRLVGSGRRSLAAAHAYSANAPLHQPNTSSPGRNSLTLRPTASTRPAISSPGISRLGPRNPATNRITYGTPLKRCQSPIFT